MRQRGLTVITEIKNDQVQALKTLLDSIDADIPGNPWINFDNFSLVHMMRWVILPPAEIGGKSIPHQLVLSTNYDGKVKPHLEELVSKGGEGFQKIYRHCVDAPKETNRLTWVEYLHSHKVSNSAFYAGVAGRTVQQIKHEAKLMDEIQDHLESFVPHHERINMTPQQLQVAVTERFFSLPGMQWIYNRSKPPFLNRFGAPLLLTYVFLKVFVSNHACVYCIFPKHIRGFPKHICGFTLHLCWLLRIDNSEYYAYL